MSFSYLSQNGSVTISKNCEHDSNIGYSADFTENGEVDNWTLFDGIHTYGCWNNFLFGTLYGEYALIGRDEVFQAVAAEHFYHVRIVMKLKTVPRFPGQEIPSKGRLKWQTLSDPVWDEDKQYDFEIFADNKWHTYILNMAELQYWQGDVNDLRIYPILADGKDGDEFYIRDIQILSPTEFKCQNVTCDYFTNYERNCPGVGKQAEARSLTPGRAVIDGSEFDFAFDSIFNVEEGANVLHVNINQYGFEVVVIEPKQNLTGRQLANMIANEISKTDIGGYAECEVEYTDLAEFVIYTGTYTNDSTIEIGDTELARYLRFYDEDGNAIYSTTEGETPASGFVPLSSYRIKTHQIHAMVDNDVDTNFFFNPYEYNVEGGRKDWIGIGIGQPQKDIRGTESEQSGQVSRSYKKIANVDKTIIDLNHPINASGRITNIVLGVTLDSIEDSSYNSRGTYDSKRKEVQLSDAKVMFFRPMRDGGIRVLPYEVSINNRNYSGGNLYAGVQEYVSLDCDIFLNKGDLIGVYNANIYKGFSISGNEIDALYYQLDGKVSGILDVGYSPKGDGHGGLLMYARSNTRQKRLHLDIDLGNRINVENVRFDIESLKEVLDYNVARCLDINWEVDLHGHDHTTGYIYRYRPLVKHYFNHPNIYYGKDCLSDGITIVPDGLAGTSFSHGRDNYYTSAEAAEGKQDGGKGVQVGGAKYFHVNGDEEWLGVLLHYQNQAPFAVNNFSRDPISFTLRFPYEKEKQIYKSQIYFKEKYNFRSFAQSFYMGTYYTGGNADDEKFNLIPERTDGTETPWLRIILDGLEYWPEDELGWQDLDLYLAKNPSIGHMEKQLTGVQILEFDEYMAYWDEMGGLVYQGSFEILNGDQYRQAVAVDWQTIIFEWPPTYAKGYRLHCDYHESTKICEMEVYGIVEDLGSTLAGSVDVAHSAYGDYWVHGENHEDENEKVYSFIGDTPQYMTLSLTPISEMHIKDIIIEVSVDDVHSGEKGCQDQLLLESSARGRVNEASKIEFENVYGDPYDLYVDIAYSELGGRTGLSYFSTLEDDESITNPLVGPDSYYKKHSTFKLLNYNSNVTINCPVYALKNLVNGAKAWYSHDDQQTWQYWGELDGDTNVNFSNLPDTTITSIKIPILVKSKWWKIGFLDPRQSVKVWEMRVFFEGEEIEGIKLYHHKGQPAELGANDDDAPHLDNDIIDGSYYVLTGNQYIGIELPYVGKIDQIDLYHSDLLEVDYQHNVAGIDAAVAFCLQPDGNQNQVDNIVDYGYYEHASTVGDGIYCDKTSTYIDYDFTEDFDTCEPSVQTFTGDDGDPPDPSFWTDINQASIENNMLKVTNSGTTGNVTTSGIYEGDFDVQVDFDLISTPSGAGWRASLNADSTDEINSVRIGRLYYTSYHDHVFQADRETTSGYSTIGSHASDAISGGFRLKRENETTKMYYYNGSWVHLASTDNLGANPVTFSLQLEYTPIASQVTTVYFDDFFVDNSAYDWGQNLSYDSTFTCTDYTSVSGIEHWVERFDMGMKPWSNASSYKIPKPFEAWNIKPMDKNWEFTFDFKFQLDNITSNGADYDAGAISIGVFDRHVRNRYGWSPYQRGFSGVQLFVERTTFGLGITSEYAQEDQVYGGTMQLGVPLYGRLSSDGNRNFYAQVWTDDWDGADRICNLSNYSNNTWWAYKIGVGCGYTEHHTGDYNDRATGWVAAYDFVGSKTNANKYIGETAMRFSGFPGEKILLDYANSPVCNYTENKFDINNQFWCFDWFIKFNNLPLETGQHMILAAQWDPRQPIKTGVLNYPCSWALTYYFDGSNHSWRFYVVQNETSYLRMNKTENLDNHRWYHYYFSKGAYSHNGNIIYLLRNGHYIWEGTSSYNLDTVDTDVTIGENLDGWVDQFRMSVDDSQRGGSRMDSINTDYNATTKSSPSDRYERRYTFSMWTSVDNYTYGPYGDVDCLFDNTYSYHLPHSTFSNTYFSYFCIDLGQRHDLEIIRSFPVDEAYNFSIDENTLFSNKDTGDPVEAFDTTGQLDDPSTDFSQQNYSYPVSFTRKDTSGTSASYVLDDSFYQKAWNGGNAWALSQFFLDRDFYITADYFLPDADINSNEWKVQFWVRDANRPDTYSFMIERVYVNGSDLIRVSKEANNSWSVPIQVNLDLRSATFKITRQGRFFSFAYKRSDRDVFEEMGQLEADSGWKDEVDVSLRTVSRDPNRPTIENYWDNFTVHEGNVVWSTANDTRWCRVKMENGTGSSVTIKRLGIYSDVSTQVNRYGEYNNYWEDIGTAITSYAGDENIALGTVVSGSSEVGNMLLENLTDGVIGDNIDHSWGGEPDTPQWFTVHLAEEAQIYSVRLYHGRDDSDTFQMATDYKVQVSTDNVSFTTIFNITGNDQFERIHDLVEPVSARFVRVYITGYKAREQWVYTGADTDTGYDFWKGPSMREIRVYKYYDFAVINSEDMPIIAIDMQQTYFIHDHYLIGPDSEEDEINWDNDDSNFAWSQSWLDDPQKVDFGDWGAEPGYEKWVVIKRNTATHYPTVPTTYYPETDNPDYLKYAIVRATVNEDKVKVNPVECPWMWRSNFSDLSYDYDHITYSTIRSLRIDYPASTEGEHVRFIEGDNLGVDGRCSWRDGISFDIYIDDIDNLDLEYGYFYFGGWDSTKNRNEVIYRWNMTTLSGVLQTGWSTPTLTFRYADEIEYTEEQLDEFDPRRVYTMVLGKIGLVFRGKGNPLQINIDGFYIFRNRFQHSLGFGYGLYLHDHDILKAPLGEFDMHSGTIEFFIRPDWNHNGIDIYNDYKFRCLFHMANVANDLIGASVSRDGFEIYYGNLSNNFKSFVIQTGEMEIDAVYHFAFVFSNDGKGIDVDGSTIRFYINNTLAGKSTETWKVTDDKHFNFTLGGQSLLLQKISEADQRASSVDGVVGRLKIHNYCKTDFTDSINLDPLSDKPRLDDPSEFIEISDDNLTFYRVGDAELPIKFEKVSPGEKVPVYVRSTLPRRLTGNEKRTAGITASWDIGV